MPRNARRSSLVLPAALAAALAFALPCLAATRAAHPADDAVLAALLRAQAARARALSSVRSDVVVELSSPAWNAAGTCQGKLAARRPGSLRLVGYVAVATVFDAATDGARFQVVIPPQKKAWVGKGGEESALVGLPVQPGDVVAALFGEPYGTPAGPRRVLAAGANPTVAWPLADGHEVRTRYDAARGLPQRAELWEGGNAIARLSYHDYRKTGGVWWASRVDFDWPASKSRLAITFERPRFGGVLSDSLFAPRLPEGVQVIDAAHAADTGEAAP